MKKKILAIAALMVTSLLFADPTSGSASTVTPSGSATVNYKASTLALSTTSVQVGYAYGMLMASSILQSEFPISAPALINGVTKANDKTADLSYDQAQFIIQYEVDHLKKNPTLAAPELRNLNFALGISAYNSALNAKFSFDMNAFIAGFSDTVNNVSRMSDDQAVTLINAATNQTNQTNSGGTQTTAMNNNSQSALAQGEAFLAQNAKQPGVVTLKDGLQYKVLVQGTGPKPTINNSVTVNYEGTTIDGTIFDSSYQRGTPITFPLGAVIKGWQEGLAQMPTGSTYMLYIPANLAYGDRQVGQYISPNSTLIFKVELISIN